MFFYLRSELEVLAYGTWAVERHDKRPWRESDAYRASKAGQSLGFFAILELGKGDLVELSTTLGFPAHGDGVAPCLSCKLRVPKVGQTFPSKPQ